MTTTQNITTDIEPGTVVRARRVGKVTASTYVVQKVIRVSDMTITAIGHRYGGVGVDSALSFYRDSLRVVSA